MLKLKMCIGEDREIWKGILVPADTSQFSISGPSRLSFPQMLGVVTAEGSQLRKGLAFL